MAWTRRTRTVRRKKPVYRPRYNRYRKKNYRSRKSSMSRKASVSINRTPVIISDRYFTKMTYYVKYLINSALSRVEFRGNSVYDPNRTGVGTTANGWSMLSALYDNYRVYGSSIRVTAVNGSNNRTPTMAVLATPITGSSYTSTYEIIPDPYCRAKTLSVAGGSADRVIIYNSMSSKKIFGVSTVRDGAEYGSLMSANPDQEWSWYVVLDTLDAESFTVEVEVLIVYYVECYSRIEPVQTSIA